MQPGRANCSPEAPLPLELRCQVTGNDNFEIQWHYSNSSSPPSQNKSTSTETVLDKAMFIITERELLRNSSSLNLISVLRLIDYETIAGYYWCTVNASQPTPNPSQAVNISVCPYFTGDTKVKDVKCVMKVDLFERTSNRCADYPASNDSNIVDIHLSPGMCMTDDNKPITTLILTRKEQHMQVNHLQQQIAT